MPKKAKNPPPPVDLNLLSPESIIRLPDVLRVTGESRSGFLLRVKKGEYPKPVKLGKRAVGWRYGDILNIPRESVG